MSTASPPQPRPTPTTPRAAVVGAGIAGLSAAIALRRAGWRVVVHERSRFKNEVGAAITVPPNAALALERWGYVFPPDGGGDHHNRNGGDKGTANGDPVPNQSMRYAAAADLRELSRFDYPRMREAWGAGAWSFHRVDLHRLLREMAEGEEGEGSPARIRLGEEVLGLDCEGGRLRTREGWGREWDLVVIADGAHSRLLPNFVDDPASTTPHHTGRSVYRWLVSTDDVRASPALRAQFDGALPGFTAWDDIARRVLFICYTCRGGRTLNCAVVHDTSPAAESEDRADDVWHLPVSRDQVLATLQGFHPTLRAVVDLASEDGVKAHRLFKRAPLESFARGRALVLGDAAHVMMPTHAAGGGIAMESAAALEVLFRGVGAGDAVAVGERLRLFDGLRVPRCNLTMLLSNAGPEGVRVPGVEEEIRRYYSGPLPSREGLPWDDEFREFMFCYDVFAAAEKALEGLGNGSRA
ncbi:hypothetical protein F4810DRAFT_725108 [Camillea tinctor]|nr:hypothetical protein F4810DRAFT_725108 [Camillea tinctor]